MLNEKEKIISNMEIKRILWVLTLFSGILVCNVNGRTSDELRIRLPNTSKLIGRVLRSHIGRSIKAFMGIPYAKPPLNELRFKPPVAAEAWEGVLHATKDGEICSQRDPFRRDFDIVGSEDCLFLNVYAPYSYDDKKTDLPVMVFFHGGGFQCGSGISEYYGPDYLLDHDLVYVGANFRLGPLGFLSTEQEDCTGNFGLKDQVEVLRWVQMNIASFGGDPKSVTIFGESAGGASTTYLMMSPLAEGLFSKAIAQSGTNFAPWAQPAHKGVPQKRATYLAKKFNCYYENKWKKTINCLRKIPAENITATFYDYFEWDMDPMVPFPPVVEPDLPGAFISKHPRDEHDPHSLNKPFMTGLTHDEGVMKSAPILNLPGLFEDFIDNHLNVLPIALNYDHHHEHTQSKITDKILEFYFNKQSPSHKMKNNLTNLFTDGWFLSAMDLYLQKRIRNPNSGPTYVYLFAHKGSASFTEIFKGGDDFYGVSHAEELQYLFPIGRELFYTAIPTKGDIQIREIITELWANFARTGNPTPSDSNLNKWSPTKQFPLNYYRIGNIHWPGESICKMESGLFDERAEFWRTIGAHLPAEHVQRDEL